MLVSVISGARAQAHSSYHCPPNSEGIQKWAPIECPIPAKLAQAPRCPKWARAFQMGFTYGIVPVVCRKIWCIIIIKRLRTLWCQHIELMYIPRVLLVHSIHELRRKCHAKCDRTHEMLIKCCCCSRTSFTIICRFHMLLNVLQIGYV